MPATGVERGVPAGIVPDSFLQRLVDLASAEVARLEAKHTANSPKCEKCGGGGELTKEERAFMGSALKEMRQVVFGARKLILRKHLDRLSDGQLEDLEEAIDGEGSQWLPP